MEHPSPNDPGRVGPYRVVALLGSGGMGRVYLGLDPSGSPAAVKLVRAEYAYDPGFRGRFARELELARRVHGNYTPRVLGADTSGQTPWLATEYVMGPSLQDLVRHTGPLPEHTVRFMGRGIAQALERVHATGLVHRDLKPGNVMVSATGPQVIDFGIARAMEDPGEAEEERISGTPGYMAPETVSGQDSGPPADVFALGGVLVHALTGDGPFGDGHPSAVLYRIGHLEPDLGGVPASLRGIVAACLEKDPARRPNAAQVLQALGGPTPPAASAADWLSPAAVARIDAVSEEYANTVRAAGAGRGRGALGRRLLVAGAAAVALTLVGGVGVWAARDAGLPGFGTGAAPEEEPGAPDREVCSPKEHLAPAYTEAAQDELTVPNDEEGVFFTGFSNDGEVLAVSGTGGVALWDWREQEEVALIEADIGARYGHPVFGPDDCELAYASDDGAYVYSLESGEVTVLAEGFEAGAVAFTPDGERLVVGNRDVQVDSGVSVYDLATGELVATHRTGSSTVLSVAVSPEGGYLAAQDLLGRTTVWDTETGETIAEGEGVPSTNPSALRFVDERTLAYPDPKGAHVQDLLSETDERTSYVTENLDEELTLFDVKYGVAADRVYATFLPSDLDPALGIMKVWEYSTGEELTADADQGFLWEISVHPEGEVITGVPATGNGMWVVDAQELRILDRF
ncbi:WD40 repeat domain-containing serine/threonine protein kinase [Nocardiopsis sp. NPDC006938]|uniref:WD40 repeat domain-containing serine/threonine protein kinase n=1 Tax=Nocardiopsis sp. NPDC006938 TaxID=3364337 RepID=UPI00367791F6